MTAELVKVRLLVPPVAPMPPGVEFGSSSRAKRTSVPPTPSNVVDPA
jgi:hypothetical protein